MMTTTPRVLAFLLAASLACDKPDIAKIRADGFSCQTVNQKGGLYVPKAGEHCFKCPDAESVAKCGSDPLHSGCREVAIKECAP